METLSTLQNKYASHPPNGGSPVRNAQNTMFYHQKVHNYGPSTTRFNTKKKILEANANFKPATTHMILNYKNKFIKDDDEEMPQSEDEDSLQGGSTKGKTLNPYNAVVLSKGRDDEVIGKIMGDMKDHTQLQSTFVLPQAKNRVHFPGAAGAKLDKIENRIFVGKINVETQTENSLIKQEFVGLSGYQEWSRQTVEPFLKALRIAIKENRPENIPDYVSAYCAALEGGKPKPKCEPAPPRPKGKNKKK